MVTPSGHLQVIDTPRKGKVWVALWRDAEGRHKRRLGPAWVRAAGTTDRGGTKWRAADGRKPDGYLAPKDAEAQLAQILAAAPRQKLTPLERHTFGEACEEHLRYVEFDRERRPSTVNDYRNTMRKHLLPHFGADRPVRFITTDDIDAFREELLFNRELSRRTAQKILVILYSTLKRAKRKKWIPANPAEDAERITLKRSGDFNVLSADEVRAVAAAAVDELDAAVFLTAAFTGLRLGELRALRWNDLDFVGERIVVRKGVTRWQEGAPKSGQVRAVPMIDQVAQVLDGLSRRERFTGPSDVVFCNEIGGFFDDGRLRLRFYQALADAGLGHLREKEDRMVFHDLRHTFGTLAVRAFPLSDVKAFMGHESIDTTMIYVHHVPQTDAAAKLGKLLSAPSDPRSLSPAAQSAGG